MDEVLLRFIWDKKVSPVVGIMLFPDFLKILKDCNIYPKLCTQKQAKNFILAAGATCNSTQDSHKINRCRKKTSDATRIGNICCFELFKNVFEQTAKMLMCLPDFQSFFPHEQSALEYIMHRLEMNLKSLSITWESKRKVICFRQANEICERVKQEEQKASNKKKVSQCEVNSNKREENLKKKTSIDVEIELISRKPVEIANMESKRHRQHVYEFIKRQERGRDIREKSKKWHLTLKQYSEDINLLRNPGMACQAYSKEKKVKEERNMNIIKQREFYKNESEEPENEDDIHVTKLGLSELAKLVSVKEDKNKDDFADLLYMIYKNKHLDTSDLDLAAIMDIKQFYRPVSLRSICTK